MVGTCKGSPVNRTEGEAKRFSLIVRPEKKMFRLTPLREGEYSLSLGLVQFSLYLPPLASSQKDRSEKLKNLPKVILKRLQYFEGQSSGNKRHSSLLWRAYSYRAIS